MLIGDRHAAFIHRGQWGHTFRTTCTNWVSIRQGVRKRRGDNRAVAQFRSSCFNISIKSRQSARERRVVNWIEFMKRITVYLGFCGGFSNLCFYKGFLCHAIRNFFTSVKNLTFNYTTFLSLVNCTKARMANFFLFHLDFFIKSLNKGRRVLNFAHILNDNRSTKPVAYRIIRIF